MTPSAIAAALDNLGSAILANPEKARAKSAPAAAIVVGRLKCRVTGPSGQQIETDMPVAMGGENSAPGPGWFFRAALAACCSTVIAQQAAREGIVLTKLEVTVEGESDMRGLLGLDEKISAGHSTLRTHVEIGARNASPEQLQDLVQWAAAHSPVGCTVRDAPANTLRIAIA